MCLESLRLNNTHNIQSSEAPLHSLYSSANVPDYPRIRRTWYIERTHAHPLTHTHTLRVRKDISEKVPRSRSLNRVSISRVVTFYFSDRSEHTRVYACWPAHVWGESGVRIKNRRVHMHTNASHRIAFDSGRLGWPWPGRRVTIKQLNRKAIAD